MNISNTHNTPNTSKMTNTFYLILHKKTAETDELYNQSIGKSTELYDKLFKNEFKLIKSSEDTPFQQSQHIALKLFIYGFIVNGEDNIIKHKYQYICKINENIFFNQVLKVLFFDAVSSTQRIYNIFNRFAYRWKCKRMVSLNAVDLFMNEINDKQKNVITIIQNKQKFLFTTTDVISLLERSLTNMDSKFSIPLVTKNPYNNVPFTKTNLFNIYFFLYKKYIRVPPLIQQFFYSGFNLRIFRDNNHFLILDSYMNKYIKTNSESLLLLLVKDMITSLGFQHKILIHYEFSKSDFLNVMKPYLKLFLLGKYSFTKEDRNYYFNELRYKLNRFHVFNPIYGKKMFDMKTNVPYFPSQYPLFESYFRDFNKTHLSINEAVQSTYNYNNHDDNDDGDGNGNEEEYNDERYYP